MPTLLQQFRAHAVSCSLLHHETLESALQHLGFVQADPIRSPARAQDLILRHRVAGYQAGDLERRYPSIAVEEDYLDTYGFLSRDVWRLLHPRSAKPLSALDRRVLETVRGMGPVHPSDLEASFGRSRVVNDWGGYSQATKRALERLHYSGLLRIARRDSGVRVYEALPGTATAHELSPEVRLQRLMLVVANQLAPVPERTLSAIASRLRRRIAKAPDHRKTLRALVDVGILERHVLDQTGYVWPAGHRESSQPPPERRVRFLAPFDPIVWDRARFEHLWGWEYRFEAYTPPARRVRGYYAMPLLWQDQVIGWANASVAAGAMNIEIGYVGRKPAGREFRTELDAEIARLEEFLNLR